ncbi:MAG: class I SAM-dependent methyltransferase [bacterium JZ-2024 1]
MKMVGSNSVWEIFEKHAERYDEWFEKSPGKEIFEIEVEALKGEAQQFPHPWLEVGVGSGRFARALGIDYGVDPSRKMLEKAKERGISVFLSSGEDLPFPDESFHLVFLIVTICFLENVPEVLREIRRVLKKGGGLIIGTILADSPWADYYQKKGGEGNPFYAVAHFYSLEEIQQFLKQADFHLIRIISTLVQPPGLSRYVPEKPTWGLHPKSGFQVIVARKAEK